MGFQAGYLRSCVWTIKSANGTGIAIDFFNVGFDEDQNCWPNYFKVYGGVEPSPDKEIFSLCKDSTSKFVKTGWNELTVVYQVHESFRSGNINITYKSYTLTGVPSQIVLSFDPIPSCSNVSYTDIEEPRIFKFNWDHHANTEVFVHYCLSSLTTLPFFVLTRPSVENDGFWDFNCNSSVCRLFTENLFGPIQGNYTFTAVIWNTFTRVRFQVEIQNPPRLHTHVYTTPPYVRGQNYHVDCDFLGWPVPDGDWFFYPAREISQCLRDSLPPENEWESLHRELIQPVNNTKHDQPSGRQIVSKQSKTYYVCNQRDYKLRLDFVPWTSGCLVCWTRNKHGSATTIVDLHVLDSVSEIILFKSEDEAIVEEPFNLTCTASVFNIQDLSWTFTPVRDDNPLSGNQLEKLDQSISVVEYSNQSHISTILHFSKMKVNNSGHYTCSGKKLSTRDGKIFQQAVRRQDTLQVIKGIVFAGINSSTTEDSKSLNVSEGSDVTLNCSARGATPLTYEWYSVDADGLRGPPDPSWTRVSSEGQTLQLLNVERKKAVKFLCLVMNRDANVSRLFNLDYLMDDGQGSPGGRGASRNTVVIASSVCAVAVVVALLCLMRWRRIRKTRETNILLPPLRCSEPEVFNIPLDIMWEFPNQRLVLGERIGQGAYGKVVKARAFGILPNQDITTVAVKMLKANAESFHQKALFAELRILIRLGRHLNVVNLLGAVTKHQNLGKLMVIVEYCEKGSLHAHLLKQRKNFICQVDKNTRELDTKLSFRPFQKTIPERAGRETDEGFEGSRQSTSGNRSRDNVTAASCKTTDTVLSTGSTICSVLPEPEPSTDEPLTTTDLIKFSYQCARGMEYIASRKLVHRDLSARNVLLTKDNIIKICDFGLTRDDFYLYNDQKKTALPIRWMAPESLGQNQFNTMTDVWSFGILLWEMFTLGDTPYPGMPIDESFYVKLFSGYRLTPSDMTPTQIASLMENCWQGEPDARPTFPSIAEDLAELLDEQQKTYYLILNAPFASMNKKLEEKDEYMNMDVGLDVGWLYDHKDDMQNAEIHTYDNLPAGGFAAGSSLDADVENQE